MGSSQPNQVTARWKATPVINVNNVAGMNSRERPNPPVAPILSRKTTGDANQVAASSRINDSYSNSAQEGPPDL